MVTTLYAGILALFYIALTLFVAGGRFQNKVNMGDGGNKDMLLRIRMHGNFAEYVPFILLLMFLAEYESVNEFIIHISGILLIMARVVHAYGLYKGVLVFRSGGTIFTVLVMFMLAFVCIRSYFFL